jgi:hypothetical protein
MIDCFKTENYLAEKKRMSKTTESGVCKVECTNCLLSSYNNGDGICCTDFEMLYPKKAIEIVQKWSDEHPQRTYLTEFLEHYPNAELDENGIPKICLWKLGLPAIEERNCIEGDCIKCWNEIIKGGEK